MSIATYATINNLLAPVSSGSTIQTFTDTSGEVWIAKNGVSSGVWKKAKDVLHAVIYRAVALNCPTAAAVIQLDTVSRDPYTMNTGLNTASAGLILPIAGWWRLYGQINGTASAVNQYISTQLWGSAQITLTNTISPLASGGISTRTFCKYKAAAGETITLRGAQTAGNALSIGVLNTRLEVSYLGTG